MQLPTAKVQTECITTVSQMRSSACTPFTELDVTDVQLERGSDDAPVEAAADTSTPSISDIKATCNASHMVSVASNDEPPGSVSQIESSGTMSGVEGLAANVGDGADPCDASIDHSKQEIKEEADITETDSISTATPPATTRSTFESIADLLEVRPRPIPAATSTFTDEIGRTVRKYVLPDSDVETWLGLWYDRKTDADTKSGIQVSNLRLSSFSTHTDVIETPKPWKATSAGGFATYIVQEKLDSCMSYQVYVAACELMRGGYSFEVDITALDVGGESDASAPEAVAAAEPAHPAAPVSTGQPQQPVVRERASTALRQRLLRGSASGASAHAPAAPASSQETNPAAREPLAESVPPLVTEENTTNTCVEPSIARNFEARLAEARRKSEAERAERQRARELEAEKKAQERKQRIREGTPMRAGRQPVMYDWRQRVTEQSLARVTSK